MTIVGVVVYNWKLPENDLSKRGDFWNSVIRSDFAGAGGKPGNSGQGCLTRNRVSLSWIGNFFERACLLYLLWAVRVRGQKSSKRVGIRRSSHFPSHCRYSKADCWNHSGNSYFFAWIGILVGKAPQSVLSKDQSSLLQAINVAPITLEEKNSLLRFLYFSTVFLQNELLSRSGFADVSKVTWQRKWKCAEC